jgi:hypothetical protein
MEFFDQRKKKSSKYPGVVWGPRVELTARTLNYIHASEFEAPAVFAYFLPPKSMIKNSS